MRKFIHLQHLGREPQKGEVNFTELDNHFVSYTDGKYKPIIDKKDLNQFEKPTMKEKNLKKGLNQLNRLSLKFVTVFQKKYMFFTIVVTRFEKYIPK